MKSVSIDLLDVDDPLILVLVGDASFGDIRREICSGDQVSYCYYRRNLRKTRLGEQIHTSEHVISYIVHECKSV